MSAQDAHIRREVEASLKQASDHQLARIMQFIDRLPSRAKLDPVVEQVRGRLALVRPARSMTLLRVLTQPFEDLLVGPELAGASPWYAPRDLVAVVGDLTLAALDPIERRRLMAMCDGKTMDDQKTVLALGAALWPAAGSAINRALAGGAVPDMDAAHNHALAGVAQVLAYGEEIVTFMEQLPPRPMPRLRDDERGAAMSLLFSLGQASPELFRYAFTMLVRRSSEPMEFFDLVLAADFGLPPEMRDELLTESAHECLHEVEVMGRDMGAAPADRPAAQHADAALRMASLIESLENAPPQVKLNPKQLADTKSRAAGSVARSYEGALTGEMRQSFRAVSNPAEGEPADDAEVARAENVARSTRKLELAGGRLGATAQIERTLNTQLSGYRNDIIKKASQARGPRMTRLSKIMDEVRLVEIVFGADVAAELLEELSD